MTDSFNISNALLADGLYGIWRLLMRTGLINVDFADLCSVTRARHAISSFATAEASGERRAEQIVEKLLAHPLLDGGQVLTDADTVLVSVVGAPDLTLVEVSKLMEPIKRQSENAHIIFGAAIDPQSDQKLSVTLIASRRSVDDTKPARETAAGKSAPLHFLDKSPDARPPCRMSPPPPDLTREQKEHLIKNGRDRKKFSRQRELPLEMVFKGRFEKSEPTIRHGEDLDLPTYIRRGVPLN